MKSPQRRTRIVRTLLLALAMTIAPVAVASPAATATASAPAATPAAGLAGVCTTPWGSTPERRASFTGKQITDVRSGRHACFDRLVIDLNDRGRGRPGYRVRYVERVTHDGSGAPVPLRGGAKIRIIVHAPAYDDQGRPTYRPADRRELVDVTDYRTFRQVAWAGSFEGQTTIGLGVRARLPMRVFVIDDADGGHRVVVDVAHSWT